jgi:hypothetical protein
MASSNKAEKFWIDELKEAYAEVGNGDHLLFQLSRVEVSLKSRSSFAQETMYAIPIREMGKGSLELFPTPLQFRIYVATYLHDWEKVDAFIEECDLDKFRVGDDVENNVLTLSSGKSLWIKFPTIVTYSE